MRGVRSDSAFPLLGFCFRGGRFTTCTRMWLTRTRSGCFSFVLVLVLVLVMELLLSLVGDHDLARDLLFRR